MVGFLKLSFGIMCGLVWVCILAGIVGMPLAAGCTPTKSDDWTIWASFLAAPFVMAFHIKVVDPIMRKHLT